MPRCCMDDDKSYQSVMGHWPYLNYHSRPAKLVKAGQAGSAITRGLGVAVYEAAPQTAACVGAVKAILQPVANLHGEPFEV